jgi:hypothetical protein
MSLPYQNGMTFYNTATPAPATSIAPPTDPGTIYQAAGMFGKHYSPMCVTVIRKSLRQVYDLKNCSLIDIFIGKYLIVSLYVFKKFTFK